MTMADWNDKKNGGQMVLTTEEVAEGNKSLKITPIGNDYGIKIRTITETDKPKNVNVIFYHYHWQYGPSFSNMANFIRYQDVNNYYSVVITIPSTGYIDFYLALREGGVLDLGSAVRKMILGNRWYQWKIEFCEVAGTVYAYIYRGAPGAWGLEAEFARSPAKFTSGGAYGVGFEALNVTPHRCFLDTTEVYYLEG